VALVLVAYLAARRRLGALALVRERPAWALAAGAVNGVSYLLLLVAFREIDVSVAEPASGLSLLVTAALAWALFREPVGWRVAGGLVMVAGTALLFL
ncbi:MAG: EamA family transporter, partial [Methanobacteriota archaeon]